MKKILSAIALIITISFGAKAQIGMTDSFFNDWTQSDMMRDAIMLPNLPGSHGFAGDVPAVPLGSGLLILGALGTGYILKKKHEK